MGTGQTFLTMGAIAIFMYMSMNINRSYIIARAQNVDHQIELDAVNYGLSVCEVMYSQAFNYSQLDTFYGNFNDVNNPSKRLDYVTVLGDSLSATISLSIEKEIIQGVDGREATITIYRWDDGQPIQVSEHLASIMSLE